MRKESSINIDDENGDESDLLLELVENVLAEPKTGVLLTFWRKVYHSSLGIPCTEIAGPSAYSKLNKIMDLAGSVANVLVVMEFLLDLRVKEIPVWKGAEIRNPSLGFLCGADRLRELLEKVDKDEVWAKKRAVYNYVHYGRDLGRMRRNMTAREFHFLEKFLPKE